MASSGAASTAGDGVGSDSGVGEVVGSASATGWEVGEGSAVAATVGEDAVSSSAGSPQPIKAAATMQTKNALLHALTCTHSSPATPVADTAGGPLLAPAYTVAKCCECCYRSGHCTTRTANVASFRDYTRQTAQRICLPVACKGTCTCRPWQGHGSVPTHCRLVNSR